MSYLLSELAKEPKQLHLDLECAPVFTIADECLTQINIAYSWVTPTGHTGAILANSVDHPAFDDLRKRLAGQGYIQIPEYPCWNGDRVLKPFILNRATFNIGDKFCSGAAIKSQIASIKRNGFNAY